MDHLFFSWLATQSYSVEVAIGTIFVVIIAPAVLAGMASLATWAERPIGELLRMSGLLNPLERGRKNLWRLHPTRHLAMRTREPVRDQLAYGLGLAAPTQSGKRWAIVRTRLFGGEQSHIPTHLPP
jgi:hypothetical protein